jgi:chorismate mutase
MRISEEIGQYKKEHNMPILQEQRYDEILQKRISQAEKMGMHSEFMKAVLVAIHEESVRHQMEIMKA